MKRKLLFILFVLFGGMGLAFYRLEKRELSDAHQFKIEYESFNGKKNDYFQYRDLSIDEKNPFIYSSAEDIVERIENKETFIVYFGDPECPWCRSVIEQAIKSANDNDIFKIYYVRMWDGFHQEKFRDVYALRNGQAILKTKGSEAYYQLLKSFDHLLSEYTLSDEAGNSVDVMEKRIFAPNFIFVRDGYAEELVQGISSKQENFNMKLNEEIVKEEKDIFDHFYQKTNSCSAQC